MAAIGAGWVEDAWIEAGWVTGAWQEDADVVIANPRIFRAPNRDVVRDPTRGPLDNFV